jgi:hypothetical protein
MNSETMNTRACSILVENVLESACLKWKHNIKMDLWECFEESGVDGAD